MPSHSTRGSPNDYREDPSGATLGRQGSTSRPSRPTSVANASSWREFVVPRPPTPPSPSFPYGTPASNRPQIPNDRLYVAPAVSDNDPLLLSVNQLGPAPEVTHAFEGRVASTDGFTAMVVTSPNQDWVPRYPIERTLVRTYVDGLWGYHEYSRWPQPLAGNMWHVACIPTRRSVGVLPEIVWVSLQPQQDWREHPSAGVPGLGFLKRHLRDELVRAADAAILLFDSTRGIPDRRRAHGEQLCMVLRQCVERMTRLPAPRAVAIAVGAHVQRVALELAGLTTYLNNVLPRLESAHDYSCDVLPVLGAFVRDASAAQTCCRIGLPTWFLQPITRDVKVWKIVHAESPKFLSQVPCDPPMHHHPDELGRVMNVTGCWLSDMVFAVSRQLCAPNMPSLTQMSSEPDPKKARVETSSAGASNGLHMPLLVRPNPVGDGDEPKKKTRRGGKKLRASARRGEGCGTHEISASQDEGIKRPLGEEVSISGRSDEPTPTRPTCPEARHPSRMYNASPFYNLPSAWVHALRAVSPLSQPPQSVVYFYPPPFLLDTISSVAPLPDEPANTAEARHDEKVHRYLHNLVRIREFCRLRLLDPTVSGHPLSIAEWRAALWGDYQVQLEIPAKKKVSEQRRIKRKYEQKNGVSRLFGNAAALPSYEVHQVHQLGQTSVTDTVAARDVRLRLGLCWEAHEINFRCELIALDSVLVPRDGWPVVHRWAREAQVSGVWGVESALISVLPRLPSDIGTDVWLPALSPEWSRCVPFLRRFLDVMVRWAEFPDYLRRMRPKSDEWTAEDYETVQLEATIFYTRAFVSRFGRLPIVPMHYPGECGIIE